MHDFTRGLPELRFLWPSQVPAWSNAKVPPPGPHRATPLLQGITPEGQDAGLWLCEEGEQIGFLLFTWPRRVVLRLTDRTAALTIRRRIALTSTAWLHDSDGMALGTVRRIGPRRAGAYVALDAGGARLTSFQPIATGVIEGVHGSVVMRDAPEDRELVRLTFNDERPAVRAAVVGAALLLELDLRGE